MYLKFFANSFGYRAADMSGRKEPRSKRWIDTRKKDRTCTLDRVSRLVGGLLEQLPALLHNTEREIAVLPLTQIQRSIEWSPETERGRALTEIQIES